MVSSPQYLFLPSWFCFKEEEYLEVLLNNATECKWLFSTVKLLFPSKCGIFFGFNKLMASAASGCKCSAPPSQNTPVWCLLHDLNARDIWSHSHLFSQFFTPSCCPFPFLISWKVKLYFYVFFKKKIDPFLEPILIHEHPRLDSASQDELFPAFLSCKYLPPPTTFCR